MVAAEPAKAVSEEELGEIAGLMGIPEMKAEWLGANVVTSGIPDLTLLTPSTRLQFPSGATIVVDLENFPCRQVADVVAQHHPEPQQIVRIVVRGNPLLRQRADRPAPRWSRTASVSAQHSAAVCFLFGDALAQRYTDDCVLDPAVQALGLLVTLQEDADFAIEAAYVTVHMRDGATYEAHVVEALGSLARPMSDAQVEAKVRALAEHSDVDVDRLIDGVWTLDDCADASRLLAYAVPGKGPT